MTDYQRDKLWERSRGLWLSQLLIWSLFPMALIFMMVKP